ncbi:peptidoglycan-binding protein [Thermosipho melanesiensis]|uniref:Peptidase M23B n=2 Tax=Thermosipho melanesiensis TaxID=46541 RepID=A6LJG4_THEM4|nr:M23 family metallopeptidase [Thermosipho melanesiensis]ABR30065.1 peptidase M23B [Thermosipho melanesiensis BI429]APT73262.1 peptidoglycan-binding protein [Thermosipho melanesiensis]OOC38658.1 peptidoglycan-binding protein [Thermosipho melanesiensis]OOC40462.1 peptidoglycan-binding protein [Thermosipho melanesiensis]OOC40727.1 peptidoglycan-binding protein [Thermosipho melanesiensis]
MRKCSIFFLLFSALSFSSYFVLNYYVQPGDTVYELSKKFRVSPSIILDWNEVDPYGLKIGEVIKIPQPPGIMYEVQQGDSLYSIALRFFTTVDRIKDANELKSNYIYVGQKLFIPLDYVGMAFNIYDKSFMWPVFGKISSTYGWRIHPIYKKRSFHSGVDISAPMGTPIFSATDGVVKFAGEYGGYGLAVIVDYGKYDIVYGHMSKICVYKGQKISKGELIGRVGSTGISTGPHLHFEVRINGKHTNPMAYLPSYGRMYVLKDEGLYLGGE